MSLPNGIQVLSRHRTTEGTLVYARRADGGLQVWLQRHEGAGLLTEGDPRCRSADGYDEARR